MNKNTDNYSDSKVSSSKSSQSSLFNLADFKKKKVEVSFTLPKTSSDGGLLLLREVDNQIGLINRLSACIDDNRHQSYVKHSVDSMLRQRIMQIAAGYEDANDCNSLKDDEIFKLCANRSEALSAQPTMSRFENQPGPVELYKMAKAFVDNFIASYESAPGIIVIDADDTSSITYGQQQFAFFNNYYGDYCFMPLHIYEGLSGKLITTILKPGRRSKSADVFAILKRIIGYLRQHWPKTLFVFRGDSHFCSKELMQYAGNTEKVEYITGLAGNSVLNEKARITRDSAEREFKYYGKPVKRYHSFSYQANSWAKPERVVVKVEVSSMGTNVRFIVSSFVNIKAKVLYEKGYCARGTAELRIKDHKTYLGSDRMSCNSFKANQFRLFMHSAAYVLIHSLQKEVLKGTEFCKATMRTVQLKIIKVATHVKVLKTKIQIELPQNFYGHYIFEHCFKMFETIRT